MMVIRVGKERVYRFSENSTIIAEIIENGLRDGVLVVDEEVLS